MSKQFYSHLVEIDFLQKELESLNLTQEEKNELLRHVHGSIHITVLDVILSELPEEHKKTFLQHLENERHEELWKHLFDHTVDISDKIRARIISLGTEFVNDVRNVREKK